MAQSSTECVVCGVCEGVEREPRFLYPVCRVHGKLPAVAISRIANDPRRREEILDLYFAEGEGR